MVRGNHIVQRGEEHTRQKVLGAEGVQGLWHPGWSGRRADEEGACADEGMNLSRGFKLGRHY